MTHPLVAKQRIEEAAQSVASTAKKRLEEATENRRSLEKFYNNLALLSGGTVALSITYLGFLKTLSNQPLHTRWLIASWALLFLCLLCATYYTFFGTNYAHYARTREYAQRRKEQHETLAEEVPHINIVGIQTKAELDAYINELRAAAFRRGEDVKWASRREEFSEFLFRACGITARTTFVAGIALLLWFAVVNISVSPKVLETRQHATSNTTPVKDKVVEIPCVGVVTFPVSVSDEDASAASKLLYDREQAARKKQGMLPCKNP